MELHHFSGMAQMQGKSLLSRTVYLRKEKDSQRNFYVNLAIIPIYGDSPKGIEK
jgi:hypothetical protein